MWIVQPLLSFVQRCVHVQRYTTVGVIGQKKMNVDTPNLESFN